MGFLEKPKTGWKFPVGIDKATGAIKGTDIETDIREAIIILLNTRPGERLMYPDYGCNLLRFTFESISYGLIKEIKDEILNTLSRFENRIENININALMSEGESDGLVFQIEYDISETGIHDEVVYEFTNN